MWHGGLLGRVAAFGAASTSILCLLSELYGVASMRSATLCLLLPGMVALAALAARGGPSLRDEILVGAAAGLVAACAYDVFRVPFVLAGMPLFRPFPLFGTLITGAPADAPLAHAVGWLYHFSNGLSFGVMYVTLFGARRPALGVVWALAIEACLLISPYADFLSIARTTAFVAVTAAAHAVFGLVLGLAARRWSDPALVR